MLTRRQLLLATGLSATLGTSLYFSTKALQSVPPTQNNKYRDLRPKNLKWQVTTEQAKRDLTKLLPLHEKKKPAQEGEWLARFKDREAGQTFVQFLQAEQQRSRAFYDTMYLQPLGTFTRNEQQAIDLTAECLTHFYGYPVKTLPVLPMQNMPESAQRVNAAGNKQWLTGYLLDELVKVRPADAVAVLGLTATDLFPDPNWNYVFGMASLQQRVGIWSTARFGDPQGTEAEQALFKRRTLKVATHETGHMFGIPHCIAYECGMNGANSLSEGDRQQFEFCPECQAKIWWSCDYPPAKRNAALQQFMQQLTWPTEQQYYQSANQKLGIKS
jgi:archaemetzincin